MKIVINQLTRMSEGFICAAGVDIATKRHIRPVHLGRLPKKLLRVHGGPFEMAAVVDLGKVTPAPNKPEVEDHQFTADAAKEAGSWGADKFWEMLEELSQPRLSTIFGPELKMRGKTSCGVDEHVGKASLGILRAKSAGISVRAGFGDKKGQVRLDISDGEFVLNLGVTDIRFHGDDHLTPHAGKIASAAKRLAAGEEVLFGVGLTRAMPTPGFTPVHWLQVNAIYFRSKPAWKLGESLGAK